MTETKNLVDTIVKAIQEKKGQQISIINLTHIDGAIAKYFVICQGNSPTQVEAITESVGDMLRENLHEKPLNVIGLGTDQWIAMDYSDVLVHIFLPDKRVFYDLENLWHDAPITNLPDLD